MSGKRKSAPVEPHTEYTHARFRCPGCGDSVPLERRSARTALCAGCSEAE